MLKLKNCAYSHKTRQRWRVLLVYPYSVNSKIMIKLFLPFLILSSLFISCNQNEPASPLSPSSVSSTLSSGTWRITYYYDSDHEETNSFTGYNLAFNSNGTVLATKNATEINGVWSTLNDDSQVKLVLAFSAGTEFSELSDDWHVLERTNTRIGLRDISGGNGGTDYLTFEKN